MRQLNPQHAACIHVRTEQGRTERKGAERSEKGRNGEQHREWGSSGKDGMKQKTCVHNVCVHSGLPTVEGCMEWKKKL